LFRRDFLDRIGLRFPEGLLFEDLLFTTTAYAAASRIAIVPALTYIWNVRREQSLPSITNRRELRNWQDRFEIHRRIDADLASRPRAAELQAAKDHKFLTVDWPLYLRDLRSFPSESRGALLDVATAYVEPAAPAARADVTPGPRVACFLAARGDLDATLTAADYVTTGGVGTDLVPEHERIYWTRRHLDEPGGRAGLDVTATGLLTAGFGATPYLAVVSEARADSASLHLSGRVHDVLGRLGAADLSVTLRVSGRFGGTLLDAPASLRRGEAGLSFTVDVELHQLARRLHPGVGHELRLDLQLRAGDAVARVPLTGRDAELPTAPIGIPNRWRRLIGATASLQERNGRMVLDLPSRHPAVDGALDVASRARNIVQRRGLLGGGHR